MGWLSRRYPILLRGTPVGIGAAGRLQDARETAPHIKPKRIARLWNGKMLRGHADQSKHKLARLWRCRLRLKRRR